MSRDQQYGTGTRKFQFCPFATSNRLHLLVNQTLWTTCEFPENVVMWHVVLFSILLSMGMLQLVLCGIQVVNGCLGCICGDCVTPSGRHCMFLGLEMTPSGYRFLNRATTSGSNR